MVWAPRGVCELYFPCLYNTEGEPGDLIVLPTPTTLLLKHPVLELRASRAPSTWDS